MFSGPPKYTRKDTLDCHSPTVQQAQPLEKGAAPYPHQMSSQKDYTLYPIGFRCWQKNLTAVPRTRGWSLEKSFAWGQGGPLQPRHQGWAVERDRRELRQVTIPNAAESQNEEGSQEADRSRMTPRGHEELCNKGMVPSVQQELPQRAAASSSIKQTEGESKLHQWRRAIPDTNIWTGRIWHCGYSCIKMEKN